MSDLLTEAWEVRYYQSGTMVVVNTNGPKERFAFGVNDLNPWLYVYGPGSESETSRVLDRMRCCEQLRDFLNGGSRPDWLDDMQRVTEEHAEDFDGTSITATGPMIDRDPPKCHWTPDQSQAAKDARARLIDRLFIPKGI